MRRAKLLLVPLVLVLAPACAGPQPHMHAALDDLRSARKELEEAESDKGGHRAKAIEECDRAIEEVRKGIEFAERR